ncbi:hypothetical protein MACJ_003697 [Theileria orientalis]|uniref:Uncharacterized protein n=1 Tax=Theileria orientalis TaxID=68886 RepID=A0A976XK66_THEOR|nr:hypothetical protein MACJ_003697 [Theileria orientalis]
MITRDICLFLILCILSPGRHNFVESGRTTLSHTRNSGKNYGHFDDSKFTHRRHNDSNKSLKRDFDPEPKFYYSDYSDIPPDPKFNFNLISLDITKAKTSKEFEYNYNPITGADIFEVKRPNLLRKVTERERLLWESKRGKYSDKVIVFKDEFGENRLKVFIADDINLKRKPKLAPPVRVPSIRKDGQDKDASEPKDDEPKDKAGESEGERDYSRDRGEEPGDRRRNRGHPRDEIIEIPKKSRERRAALKRHEEEMRSRRRREEARAKDEYRHKSSRGSEFRHMEDYKHSKMRHEARHGPEGRRRHRKHEYVPGDLFFLFASTTPNEKKFDLLVNGQTERFEFRSGAQCVRVKVDDHILWKHKRHQSYPTSLEFDKREGMILLEFPEFTGVYVNAEGKWYYRI